VSPPWVALTHLQWRFRNCSEDCRRCVGGRRCNHVAATTVVTAGVERESNRLPNRRFTNHGGLMPPALARAPFARRRNYDFCDAQTHTQQERRA